MRPQGSLTFKSRLLCQVSPRVSSFGDLPFDILRTSGSQIKGLMKSNVFIILKLWFAVVDPFSPRLLLYISNRQSELECAGAFLESEPAKMADRLPFAMFAWLLVLPVTAAESFVSPMDAESNRFHGRQMLAGDVTLSCLMITGGPVLFLSTLKPHLLSSACAFILAVCIDWPPTAAPPPPRWGPCRAPRRPHAHSAHVHMQDLRAGTRKKNVQRNFYRSILQETPPRRPRAQRGRVSQAERVFVRE